MHEIAIACALFDLVVRQARNYRADRVTGVTMSIGGLQVARIGGIAFGAGVVFFPLSYLFGDILTEVYGYARSRKVIWAGFGALIFATFMTWVILALPPATPTMVQSACLGDGLFKLMADRGGLTHGVSRW